VATGKFSVYDEWMSAGHHGEGHDAAAEPAENAEHSSTISFGASTAKAEDAHGEHEGASNAGHGGNEHGASGDAPAHTPQEAALHHEVLQKKSSWLNKKAWLVRAFVYFVVWCLIALGYFRLSLRQDETKDPAITRKLQSLSSVSLIAFGLTLTFAAFDWVMALEPAWYSTIFGVIVFAGSAVGILAATILIGLQLQRSGASGDAINTEHFHDLAKLMFGFICFWTYVQFSQWMLIWYAGIPEEATWFHRRWQGGWSTVSYLLIFGHFVAPFLLLMSRVFKRSLWWLQAMCVWVLLMHIVDVYWFIMPQATAVPHFAPKLVDFAAIVFCGGTVGAYILYKLNHVPVIPVGDPRLQRSIHHHQSY
ncbi:MAG: hypothetical protein R3A47_11980, partial [Polyangiales bacterium]